MGGGDEHAGQALLKYCFRAQLMRRIAVTVQKQHRHRLYSRPFQRIGERGDLVIVKRLQHFA